MKVKKAVILAAGMGTRMLPSSKVIPKELLPVIDTPAIQVVVEEAVASGIEEIILVISPGKETVVDHFEPNLELERHLEDRGKHDILEIIRRSNSPARITVAEQRYPLGLGHAVLQAREAVGDEPFAVMLPDDIFDCPRPCLRQLLDVAETRDAPVVALLKVARSEISKYGIVDAKAAGERTYELRGMVEKPPPEKAPSEFAIMGRYVLTPDIFELLADGQAGRRRRNPVDRRADGVDGAAQDLRLRVRGGPLRPGRSGRVHLGTNRFRAQARRPGRPVASLPEVSYLTRVIAFRHRMGQ